MHTGRAGTSEISQGASGQRRCRYCSSLLSALEHYAGGICSAWRCRERRLQDELNAFRTKTAHQVCEPAPERYPIVVVPHRRGGIVPVEPDLMSALEDRLTELAGTCAGLQVATVPADTDAPPPVPAVCASCHGACCYHGGPHAAFLDEETIGAFATRHPELSAHEIKAAYLNHVPGLHFAGSCVFHTDRGCNLPRTMRAQICNHYECRGLRMARELGRGSRPALFVVARHEHAIVHGEFVDRSNVEPRTRKQT